MKRRPLLAGIGIALPSSSAGCLGDFGRDGVETRRENACDHMPDDGNRLDYESARVRNRVGLIAGGYWDTDDHEDGIQFVLVTSSQDVDDRLRLEKLDASDDAHSEARSFVDATDFDDRALLVWHTTVTAGHELEVVGIDRPEADVLRAYTCSYDGTGPDETSATADGHYTVLIRVAASGDLERATLTHDTPNSTTTYETENDS